MPNGGSRRATHDSFEVGPETRVGDRHAVGAGDLGALAEGARQREQHRHAVVVVTVDAACGEPRRTDPPPIASRLNIAAELRKTFGDDGEAIGLFGA